MTFSLNKMKKTLAGIFLAVMIGVMFGCSGGGKATSATSSAPATQKVELSGQPAYEISAPGSVEPGRKYPLFIFLSPNGSPQIFIDVALPVCREKGCYFAASYQFRNDIRIDDFLPPLKATLEDIRKRFPIDSENIFIGGFSGGGMASYVMSYFLPGTFRGVLICNGALHENLRNPGELLVSRLKKAAIIMGKADNVVTPEILREDERLLKEANIKVQKFPFDGGHTLAGSSEFRQAISWLLEK